MMGLWSKTRSSHVCSEWRAPRRLETWRSLAPWRWDPTQWIRKIQKLSVVCGDVMKMPSSARLQGLPFLGQLECSVPVYYRDLRLSTVLPVEQSLSIISESISNVKISFCTVLNASFHLESWLCLDENRCFGMYQYIQVYTGIYWKAGFHTWYEEVWMVLLSLLWLMMLCRSSRFIDAHIHPHEGYIMYSSQKW